jgi:hypothetical protein
MRELPFLGSFKFRRLMRDLVFLGAGLFRMEFTGEEG